MSFAISNIEIGVWAEGARAGSLSAIVSFAGCFNWPDGLPHTRSQGPMTCADYCDARMQKGVVVSEGDILSNLDELWARHASDYGQRYVVLTGGEPADQVNAGLAEALNAGGWFVHLETSGARPIDYRESIDHLVLSPKRDRTGGLVVPQVDRPDEVRVVHPGWASEDLDNLAEVYPYAELYLTPLDPLIRPDRTTGATVLQPARAHHGLKVLDEVDSFEIDAGIARAQANLSACLTEIARNPRWKLAPQTHKLFHLSVRKAR